jgi:hypothetical protein
MSCSLWGGSLAWFTLHMPGMDGVVNRLHCNLLTRSRPSTCC